MWTLPALRMKASREHRVLLPKRALEILAEAAYARGDLFEKRRALKESWAYYLAR